MDRAAILVEELEKPVVAKAISERYYPLEAEKKEMKRNVDLDGNPLRLLLFERQRWLQQQINALFSERYKLVSRLHKDNTRYYATPNEDRSQHTMWWNAEEDSEFTRTPSESFVL